jgi:hypothetical protein
MKKNAWVYEALQARESLKKTCQCQRVFRNANAKRVTRKGVSPSYSGTRVEKIMLSSFPALLLSPSFSSVRKYHKQQIQIG